MLPKCCRQASAEFPVVLGVLILLVVLGGIGVAVYYLPAAAPLTSSNDVAEVTGGGTARRGAAPSRPSPPVSTAAHAAPRSAPQAAEAEADPRPAGAWPMFGGGPSRNMANPTARNLPTEWEVEGGKFKNVKWSAQLGTYAYGGPVVAGGKVYVGTNNAKPRDPKVQGDKAIIMCFDEPTGKFLWQNAHDLPPAKVTRDEAVGYGMYSTPAVDGGKLYYVTPAAVVVCASADDGKILWTVDLMQKYDVFPCFGSSGCPLVVGDTVYTMTGNGTNEEYQVVSPKAPSFIALNKNSGEVLWTSNLPGDKIFEGQWGNPAYAEVNGKGQVIFPGGDNYLYGLDAKTGEMIWKFHCNLTAEEQEAKKAGKVPNFILSAPVIYDNKAYIGIGLYPEHFAGNKIGHLWCIDITKKGDVSPKDGNLDPKAPENKDSALVWHYGGEINPRPKFGRSAYFGRTMSTAAIHGGLIYMAEESGYMHCLDAQTGKKYWDFDFRSGILGSPLWADGKIYAGTEDGELFVLADGKETEELANIYMEEPIQTAPVAVGDTLYLMTRSKLYAISKN